MERGGHPRGPRIVTMVLLLVIVALAWPHFGSGATRPIPANYWTRYKAQKAIVARPRYTTAECHGVGIHVIRRNGRAYWKRLSCMAHLTVFGQHWLLFLPIDHVRYQLIRLGDRSA